MNLIKKVNLFLFCIVLCGLTGCSNPDTINSPDTNSNNFKSDEKTNVSINNYISVETKESSDNAVKRSQPPKKAQSSAGVEVAEAPVETTQKVGWVQTDQGHNFYIPDGFSPVEVSGIESGKSYYYTNPDLKMTIDVWEGIIGNITVMSGWDWVSEGYNVYKQACSITEEQKGDDYFVIQGLTEEENGIYVREQFTYPWVVQYTLRIEYPNNDSYRTGEFQRICREFANNFRYAASPTPAEVPNEFNEDEIEDAEEKVAQIRSWYYAFQEEKGKCATKTINNATAYYLNGEIQSIELLNNEGGTREFYYYAPGSQRLYFVYLEGISDKTNQKRVYIWEGQLVQWIDPSGTVRHDDPEKLLAGCSQVSVYQFGLFAN